MKRTWITEVSVFCGIVGGALLAVAASMPTPADTGAWVIGGTADGMQLYHWLNMIGTFLVSIGGGGGIYRISKKAGTPDVHKS